MSKVLIIRHLPTALTLKEKEQLLKHFGAEKVWEPSSKRNYTFAAFSSEHTAQQSLYRLHQLEIANRRLVVEYSFEKEPAAQKKEDDERSSLTTKHVKEFLRRLNAWNPSVDFYQPPLNYIKYKYPEISPKIIINIIHALVSHKPLYVQTLHLMNKMCLQTPFNENNKAMDYFKETFREFFLDQIMEIPVPDLPAEPESELESELSSDETEHEKHHQPAVTKRKHTLPVTRKRPAAVLKTAVLPKVKKTVVSQEEVFEMVTVQEPKKISLVVHQDALQKPSEETEVVGELGKFQKEDEPVQEEPPTEEPDLPTITKNELLRNRISRSDMKVMKVFKNYHPGQPSMRLYIKNLAKSVTEQELKRIYRRYIEGVSEEEQIGFDVRVMQEGRMKGQAFVTFPFERMAEKALNETNGYMLKEKPMVVQFARAANKTVQ
ncbi:RNA-binding region-containing protein 3 [Cydia pomonella]|uniref:RNA-binding region-containing protein 3 n=1 Tax=Cydia pomonella TaxID=82600 RepID=UPI002ADDBEF4|nr:RNA-binding region-containing protein 3 [Cydia pomonella]